MKAPLIQGARTPRASDRLIRPLRLPDGRILGHYQFAIEDAGLLPAVLEGLYVGRDNKVLLVARAGVIISLNELAAELCGGTPDDLVGDCTIASLLLDTSPETAATLHRWETVLRSRRGEEIPVEVVREPLGTRLTNVQVYAVRDLRMRNEAAADKQRKNLALLDRERQLQLQNLRFDTAINNMQHGLAMFDAQHRLQVANLHFGALLGVPNEAAVVGASLRELLRHVRVAVVDPLGTEPQTPDSLHSGDMRLADDRLVSILCRPMADGGFVITVEDVTARDRASRKLEDHTHRLEQSNQELQHFASVASHDLQEPLRKIETFSDRIVRRHGEDLPAEVTDQLGRMQNAAGRMRKLITDLLSYGRLDSQAKAHTALCLNEVLAGVVSDLQIRIEETQAQVVFTGLPTIEADATQMRQLFQNLISNALKFTRKNVPPVITIKAITHRTPGEQEMLVLTVADNGIGFDNRFKDQIFKLFQRLHGRSEYEGTGVGLATCRRIVSRHKGMIDADGRPGEGATFIVRLPTRQPGV